MIEVFARRANSPAADALVAQLRASGSNARVMNSRYFDTKQIDRAVVLVYHDGTDPLIPWAYEQRGVKCELMPGFQGETAHEITPADYHIEKAGVWYRLIGPDGQQVGKGQRSEADAWALRPARATA